MALPGAPRQLLLAIGVLRFRCAKAARLRSGWHFGFWICPVQNESLDAELAGAEARVVGRFCGTTEQAARKAKPHIPPLGLKSSVGMRN